MKKKIIFLAVILVAILLCRISDKQNQKILVKGFGKEVQRGINNPLSFSTDLKNNREFGSEQNELADTYKGVPYIGENQKQEDVSEKEYNEAVSLTENKAENKALLGELNQKQNKQPLLFLENKGQILDTEGNSRPDILYTAKSNAASVFVASSALHYQFTNIKTDSCSQTIRETHRFTVQLENVNPEPLVETSEPETYTEHYYNERFPEGLKGVRSFTEITLKDIYPGIDWVIYGKGNFMEYDFIVHPGADPKQIRFRINDADKASLTENGDLKMETRLGEVLKHAPISFVEEQQVASHFEVYDDGSYGFDVIAPKGKTLRIDPYVEWATYYGGTEDDTGSSVALDAAGNVYLAGTTETDLNDVIAIDGYTTTINIAGTLIPYPAGGSEFQGEKDAYLVKFNSSGERLWATYYGGSGNDQANYVAVSPSNYVYLVGTTTSTSGIAINTPEHISSNTLSAIKPMVMSSYSSNDKVNNNPKAFAFLVKFDSNADRKWAAYYTSRYDKKNNQSYGVSCAFNPDGSKVYLLEEFAFEKSGVPSWVQPLLWSAAIVTAFIPGLNIIASVAIAAVGVAVEIGLEYGTEDKFSFGTQLFYLDAEDGSYINNSVIIGENSTRPTKAGGLAVAVGGNPSTGLVAIPYVLVNATDDRLAGNISINTKFDYTNYPGSITGDISSQAVVIRFNYDLTETPKHRYYGGSDIEIPKGIAVDPSNEWVVYITGLTKSSNNIHSGGYDPVKKGESDAFLAKLNMLTGYMVWSTYFGKWGDDIGTDVAVAPDGSVYLAGATSSEWMEYKGYDNEYSGNGDGFLAKFSSDGQELLMYTYVGGISTDIVKSIAVRDNNKVYVAGTTHSGSDSGYGGEIVRKGYGHKTEWNASSKDEAFLIKYTEPVPSDSGRLYVKKGGTGDKTGRDWNNALPELADALIKAEHSSGISEIWVAKGTYVPYYRPDFLSAGNSQSTRNLQTFKLVNNVKVYGNFAGNETSPSQRNFNIPENKNVPENASILSGVLDSAGNNDGKAYHVVLSVGDVGTAELNGFIIAGGNALYPPNNPDGTPPSSPPIENELPITVNGKQITKYHGGGMYIHSSSPKIVNCIFRGNDAVYGGGVHSRNGSNPEFVNCAFQGNKAFTNGGAIDSYNTGNTKLVNCVVSGNKAKNGGALFHAGTTSQLINATVAGNVSTESGNEVIDYEGGVSFIQNSIIYGNTNGLKNAENTTVSYCLVQGLTDTTNGNISGSTNPQFVDPTTVVASSEAQITGDYRLKTTGTLSPAINAGNNNYVLHNTDSDHNNRIANGTVDMGAYEVAVTVTTGTNGIVYVKQGGKGNGSSWEEATGDLQTAIKTPGATQVWVAGGTYNPISRPDNIASLPNEGNNTFLLVNNVKIYGGFAGTETILEQRDLSLTENTSTLDGAYYAHHVVVASGAVGTAELNGFTIKGGNAMGGDSQVTVNGNQITKNHGGGMYIHSSSPKIVNCTFQENIAVYGGGVHSRAGSYPEFVNCIFKGNTASLNGGAADNFEAHPNFINCVLTGNKAQRGGAIYHYLATSRFFNSTVSGNMTTGSGEGVIEFSTYYSSSGIYNSIIYGNDKNVKNIGVVTVSYSLVQGLSNTNNGNLNGNTDPLFVSPALASDAPTTAGDYRLQSCSSVINAGSNNYTDSYFQGISYATDSDNNDRIINTIVDMGAYEHQETISIVYVKQGGTGSGKSWECATGNMQAAIDTAQAGGQVWVAKGTYQPVSGESFEMKEGVAIYGGFPDTGSPDMDDRNWTDYPTTLQGNGNSVIRSFYGYTNATVLDGFVITGGNTSSGGGGMNISGSPAVFNCIFTGNTAQYGGGIYISGSPIFTNCTFTGNTSNNSANEMYNSTYSSGIFINCLIANNTGSLIWNIPSSSGSFTFINTTIIGGNISFNNKATILNNSIVWGTFSGTNYTNNNSLIKGINSGSYQENDIFDSNYRLKSCSPAINTGNNDYITYDTDLDGNERITNGTVDMGAFEYDGVPCGVIWTVNNEWFDNIEPTINDDVIIQGDLAVGTDYGSFSAKTLTVENTGSLVITSNNSVTVAGEITNNTGISDFVVENDANLIQTIAYTGANTGAITVKRESSLIKHLDYTLWSSPVAEQGLRAFSPQTLWYRIYDYNATIDQWNQIFGNSSDDDVDFQEGVGYMFRSPNNFVTTPYTYNGEFKGVPNNGNVTVTFNELGTYQGVGNPYPSNISIQQFKNVNGTGALYFWTNTNAWNNTTGDYVANNWATYNGVGGVAAANDNKAPNAFIPVGQGFVFQTAANSVTFTNAMRTSNEGVFFKTMDEDKHRLWLNLSDDEQILNQTLIGYTVDATQGLDFGIDAKLFSYSGSALYSLIENAEDDFVIQGRALPFDDNDVVPLGFRANEAGNYTISLADFDGIFAEGQDIFIKDNLTQTQQNLKNGNYSFISEQGIFNNRFEVVYKQSGTLDITNPNLSNSWVVYKQNKVFHIFSEGFEMKEVEVYDMLGRIIYASEAEGNSHILPYLGANQVLIVKITTTENEVSSKKVQN